MQIDNSALAFNSSPLYRFILQEGKFKGVEFYFKNVELDHHNTPDSFDIAFETEIIGGNYKDMGYEGEMIHLNSLVNEKNEDMFKLEIGKILHNLLLLNDPRVILHKGRIEVI
tara:strand:- start:398 stop:736 length:339 start_codon:yes stop_codon:yes gene_type:complete